MLFSGFVLLHDSARPHTAAAIKRLLKRFRWEVFDHPPSSFRTWLPVIFISFLVRNGRRRTTFWHSELQTSLENWLNAQAAGFYDEGIGKLVPRYKKVYVGALTMQRRRWQVWLNVANKIFLIFTVVLMSRSIGP